MLFYLSWRCKKCFEEVITLRCLVSGHTKTLAMPLLGMWTETWSVLMRSAHIAWCVLLTKAAKHVQWFHLRVSLGWIWRLYQRHAPPSLPSERFTYITSLSLRQHHQIYLRWSGSQLVHIGKSIASWSVKWQYCRHWVKLMYIFLKEKLMYKWPNFQMFHHRTRMIGRRTWWRMSARDSTLKIVAL